MKKKKKNLKILAKVKQKWHYYEMMANSKSLSKHDTETLSDVYYFDLNLLLLSGIGKIMKVKPRERKKCLSHEPPSISM